MYRLKNWNHVKYNHQSAKPRNIMHDIWHVVALHLAQRSHHLRSCVKLVFDIHICETTEEGGWNRWQRGCYLELDPHKYEIA